MNSFEKNVAINCLIGSQAPLFSGKAINGSGEIVDFSMKEVLKKKKKIFLVFYPLAFTMVCPTELVAINNRIEEFRSRDVEVVAISIDSEYSLLNWRKIPLNKAGVGELQYLLFSDLKKDISSSYGVLDENSGVAFRASFWIDKEGIINFIEVNNMNFGRNFDYALDKFDAMDFNEKSGMMCPSGWKKGKGGFTSIDEVEDLMTSEGTDL